MFKNSIKIAIIPARSGSKRVPKKNIKSFFGKPLIAHTIIKLKKSKIFDHIIVSTDSKKIASISKKYGADVPFLRPKNLSGDKPGTFQVLKHAVSWLNKKGFDPELVCCVYPTAVLLQIKDLKYGLKAIKTKKWNYVISATTFEHPIFRSFKNTTKGKIKLIYPKKIEKNTQNFEDVYHDAGQFYWGKKESWLKKSKIIGPRSKMIPIPRWRTQDIDTMNDWHKAKIIFQLLKNKNK